MVTQQEFDKYEFPRSKNVVLGVLEEVRVALPHAFFPHADIVAILVDCFFKPYINSVDIFLRRQCKDTLAFQSSDTFARFIIDTVLCQQFRCSHSELVRNDILSNMSFLNHELYNKVLWVLDGGALRECPVESLRSSVSSHLAGLLVIIDQAYKNMGRFSHQQEKSRLTLDDDKIMKFSTKSWRNAYFNLRAVAGRRSSSKLEFFLNVIVNADVSLITGARPALMNESVDVSVDKLIQNTWCPSQSVIPNLQGACIAADRAYFCMGLRDVIKMYGGWLMQGVQKNAKLLGPLKAVSPVGADCVYALKTCVGTLMVIRHHNRLFRLLFAFESDQVNWGAVPNLHSKVVVKSRQENPIYIKQLDKETDDSAMEELLGRIRGVVIILSLLKGFLFYLQ